MDDKIIVTNRSALKVKYGSKGLAAVRSALSQLVAADTKRGIKTRTLYLDDAPTMKKLGGKPVTEAGDPRQNKAAIDAVYKALNPDYLLILGAPDVVPHQDLTNFVYKPGDDDDKYAWGDLPYACDAPYSRDPARFVGPARVVSRLPDLVSAKEPSYLIGLLKVAKSYAKRTKAQYANYFALSAKKWQGSTSMNATTLFGNANALQLSPPRGPSFTKTQLGQRAHLINCHGAPADPSFYGQEGQNYPTALTTKATSGKISEGTVAAVECCYGGELYDALTLALDLPICQSYLKQGAYGYLGSTTIAYGPANGNGSADLICQYFLRNILEGASIGRAGLLARQEYVQQAAQMDPIDLKTLSQFNVLGDPSIHPVDAGPHGVVPKGTSSAAAERFFRAERRTKMRMQGEFLAATKPTASKQAKRAKTSQSARAALSNIAKSAGLGTQPAFKTFTVKGARPTGGRVGKSKVATVPTYYHLAVGTPKRSTGFGRTPGVAVVAKELSGRIVAYRIYEQK